MPQPSRQTSAAVLHIYFRSSLSPTCMQLKTSTNTSNSNCSQYNHQCTYARTDICVNRIHTLCACSYVHIDAQISNITPTVSSTTATAIPSGGTMTLTTVARACTRAFARMHAYACAYACEQICMFQIGCLSNLTPTQCRTRICHQRRYTKAHQVSHALAHSVEDFFDKIRISPYTCPMPPTISPTAQEN